jgi:hypothetical protein
MSSRRIAWIVLVGAIAPALSAGCFGPSDSPIEVVPYLALNDAQPGRGTEFAFHLHSTHSFKQSLGVRAEGLPAGWSFRSENDTVEIAGGQNAALIVRITPSIDAKFGPQTVNVLVGDTHASVIVNVRPLGHEPLAAGVGTQLSYVLFAANGSVIESNEPSLAQPPTIPWSRLDNGTPDFTPLKVYVGGKRGTPPPEPYNSTGCTEPPCYHPVIDGFDARLRDSGDGSGMVEGETLAVRIPKERAYTYAGNEKHALFGQDLNFLIRIVSVDNLGKSCPLPVCTSASG